SPQSFNCHCRDCQRASGTAYSSFIIVPPSALKLTRQPKFYSVKSDTGHTVSRGFCPECGSPIFGKITELPEVTFIHAASLHDPVRHRPAANFFVPSAQPCDSIVRPRTHY